MQLYRIELINKQPLETFIANFKSEREAFAKMNELKDHMINTGYSVISEDLDHFIVTKTMTNGVTIEKRFELE
jgi:hypothetical protein